MCYSMMCYVIALYDIYYFFRYCMLPHPAASSRVESESMSVVADTQTQLYSDYTQTQLY